MQESLSECFPNECQQKLLKEMLAEEDLVRSEEVD